MKPFFYSILLSSLILTSSLDSLGQPGIKKRVLFLGNSYTYVNNLPVIVNSIAWFNGDTVQSSENLIGGYTLKNHSLDPNSLQKLSVGNWDYVVLQEQSQLPSFPEEDVESQVYPYAKKLDSLIHLYSPCAKTLFYMTWGRKNGDASNCPFWPPVCTYAGMDSILYQSYLEMGKRNHAQVSPVGAVWKYLRINNPDLELYDTDGSHPSQIGSYAAACAIYTSIFKRNPLQIGYNFELDTSITHRVHEACKYVIFDSLNNWNFNPNPEINFNFESNGKKVQFQNLSDSMFQSYWDFGDGNTSQERHPFHTYASNGEYEVKLKIYFCSDTLSMKKLLLINSTNSNEFYEQLEYSFYPNPATKELVITNHLQKGNRLIISRVDGSKSVEVPIEQSNSIIDISALESGIYFISITEKGQIVRSPKLLAIIRE